MNARRSREAWQPAGNSCDVGAKLWPQADDLVSGVKGAFLPLIQNSDDRQKPTQSGHNGAGNLHLCSAIKPDADPPVAMRRGKA